LVRGDMSALCAITTPVARNRHRGTATRCRVAAPHDRTAIPHKRSRSEPP
jgi:hypothetical protein